MRASESRRSDRRRLPFKLFAVLSVAAAVFKDRADLVAENVALRHRYTRELQMAA